MHCIPLQLLLRTMKRMKYDTVQKGGIQHYWIF